MRTKGTGVRRQASGTEVDVQYWELELIAAVKAHEDAMTTLSLAADELHEVRAKLRAARERLATSRRQPTPITVHPKWRKERSA